MSHATAPDIFGTAIPSSALGWRALVATASHGIASALLRASVYFYRASFIFDASHTTNIDYISVIAIVLISVMPDAEYLAHYWFLALISAVALPAALKISRRVNDVTAAISRPYR